MDVLQQIGWVDLALGAVLLASVVVGIARGFVFELLSLAGWVAAWFAAQWLAPQVAPHILVGAPASALNHGAAFAIVMAVTNPEPVDRPVSRSTRSKPARTRDTPSPAKAAPRAKRPRSSMVAKLLAASRV